MTGGTMATIKAYTGISQSRKLAEFLPHESADMCFVNDGTAIKIDANSYNVRKHMWEGVQLIPCWSLAALLDILPKYIDGSILRMDIGEKDFSIWYDDVGCMVNTELPDIITEYPVDACVEIIEKLHELNLL